MMQYVYYCESRMHAIVCSYVHGDSLPREIDGSQLTIHTDDMHIQMSGWGVADAVKRLGLTSIRSSQRLLAPSSATRIAS
jgi:hypothetical protein